MKAVRVHQFGEPEVMKLEEVPDPRPEAGQVVVAVRAIGVNPVETYIRAGGYPSLPKLPYTPGTDGAGIVESVGEGIVSVVLGDRVYFGGTITGAYAEKALCRQGQVHRLPDRLSFTQGAAINIPYCTAYRAIFSRAKAEVGEIVLVHGATGGVGLALVQLAREAGMVVVATAGSEAGRKLLADQGIEQILDHHSPEHFKQVMALTQGRGVDVIIEMLANVNLDGDLGILARNGRVVVVGSRGRIEIDPRDTMKRDAAILGMTLMNAPEAELTAIHAALGTGLAAGDLVPVVGKELALADASRAHHEIIESRACGKIVLLP